MTGYPWATGDALLAHDLNAAFANGAAFAGGPFLPLSGGTVSGATTFGAAVGVSGTLSLDSVFNIGTGVAPLGNTRIQTPNGSHILLNAQGAAHVKVGDGIGPLDMGAVVQTTSIVGSGLSGSTTQGWQQNATLTGSNSAVPVIAFTSLETIRMANSQIPLLSMPAALVGRRGGDVSTWSGRGLDQAWTVGGTSVLG